MSERPYELDYADLARATGAPEAEVLCLVRTLAAGERFVIDVERRACVVTRPSEGDRATGSREIVYAWGWLTDAPAGALREVA